MNSMDKEYSDHMGRLTTSMERLTGSIAEGFTMLRQMMLQSSTMPPHAPPHFPTPQASYQNMGYHNNIPTHPRNSGPSTSTEQFSYTQSLFSNDDYNF